MVMAKGRETASQIQVGGRALIGATGVALRIDGAELLLDQTGWLMRAETDLANP
jgi:hypothetical protein